MASFLDSLPPWARTSTTGQGLAGIIATTICGWTYPFLAAHVGAADLPTIVGAEFAGVGAIVLLLFPQAAGPVGQASQVTATDLRELIDAVKNFHPKG